jgi:hypothetical protein
MTMEGSCLCGAVRFEIAEPFITVSHCHCEYCKRIAGGVGTTSGRSRSQDITITAGGEHIRSYTPPEGSAKSFCSACGSNLFGGGWPDSELCSVRLPAIDSGFEGKPEAHNFVRSVAAWETLPYDDLPRYEVRAT